MGCPQLLDHVIRVSPMLHMFGHCHYESGVAKAAVIDHRDVFASRLQHKKSLFLDTRDETQSNQDASLGDVNFNNSVEQRVESNSTKPAPVITTIEESTYPSNETNADAGVPWVVKNAPSEMRTNHF